MFLKNIKNKNIGLVIVMVMSPYILSCCIITNEYEYNKEEVDKNIILFIEGNNDLNLYSDSLVSEMLIASNRFNQNDACLFIVYDDIDSTKIYDVQKNLYHSYPKQNVLNVEYLKDLLKNCINAQPAKEYGLILWSHGTGWIRTNVTRSFGDDNGKDLNIDKLSQSLPIKFDYIIFDACYMSCVEVVAELEQNSDYILASPESVPALGIVNANCIDELMSNCDLETRLSHICDYYKEKYIGHDEVSLALIKTNEINNLMNKIKKINNTICISNNELETVHYYKYRNYKLFFDLHDVLLINSLKKIDFDIKSLVKYNVFSGKKYKESSGISIFLPLESNKIYYESYKGTYWNKQTNWLEKIEQEGN